MQPHFNGTFPPSDGSLAELGWPRKIPALDHSVQGGPAKSDSFLDFRSAQYSINHPYSFQ
ncbi:hypothetical protein SAMN05444340_1174 [Citreimonas salinaria]|uniref:Uncharacterized protein n=1 Tax=Citreimonas salinaria TaxID=321339 RepID=A0A1H3MFS7_9RHOB|nr:hypothetical protein SAMN05444340_1174 [Citreimonas salinaria]